MFSTKSSKTVGGCDTMTTDTSDAMICVSAQLTTHSCNKDSRATQGSRLEESPSHDHNSQVRQLQLSLR